LELTARLAHRITMLGQNGAVRLGCYVEMGEEIIVPWRNGFSWVTSFRIIPASG
jgi:hypothetical protein